MNCLVQREKESLTYLGIMEDLQNVKSLDDIMEEDCYSSEHSDSLYYTDSSSTLNDEQHLSLNSFYRRTYRQDSHGKYRIGPAFITKDALAEVVKKKPGKLKININYGENKSKFAVLLYLLNSIEQSEKTSIDLQFIKCLLDFGIDINKGDDLGQTILHAFVRDWHPDLIYFAIRNKADVNKQDDYGRSPIHLAAALNNADVARILLLHRADPNLETFKEHQTPVHYASKFNSIDVLKELLRNGGSVKKKDYKCRTALFLAAETGSKDTTDFLIDAGMPSATFDVYGNSTLSYIIEKVPTSANKALRQFTELSKHSNHDEFHLSALEAQPNRVDDKTLGKSSLEVIAIYNDYELVMHTVVQEAIAVKWKLFGRKDALKQIFLTLFYIILWILLVYILDTRFDTRDFQDHPYKGKEWVILVEVIVILLCIYFFIRDLILFKRAVILHKVWIEEKVRQARLGYIMCHPSWPLERENLNAYIDHISTVQGLSKKVLFWFIYEWVNLAFITICIVLRILSFNLNVEKKAIFIIFKIAISLNMAYAMLRLIKVLARFKIINVFLKMTSHAGSSFIQIIFLYLQFYIPFVALFWLWFGIPNVKNYRKNEAYEIVEDRNNKTIESVSRQVKYPFSLLHLVFLLYMSNFEQYDIDILEITDPVAFHFYFSLFQFVTTVVALSIIIAFITANFSTNIKRCFAEASLSQASMLILLEQGLQEKERLELKKYYKKQCSPITLPRKGSTGSKRFSSESVDKLDLIQVYLNNMKTRFNDFDATTKVSSYNTSHHENNKTHEDIMGNVQTLSQKLGRISGRLPHELKYLVQQQEQAPVLLKRIWSSKHREGIENENEENEQEE